MGVMMSVEPFPEWLRPPVGGWTAEDLDRLPDLPPHTELIDGNLVFRSPQSRFHYWTVRLLENALMAVIPPGWDVSREFSVVLGKRNRPEPDLMVAPLPPDAAAEETWLSPGDVLLAVEVVSPESKERDRVIKPRKYAAAGIRYFWRVESDEGRPVVYTYELDPATNSYATTGIFHDRLKVDHPFPLDIALAIRPNSGPEMSSPGTPE
ncbi:Uma2 family endonuclease [Kitasatospora sp. GP30]|uniref:Uma2 family endonuclease n=1 Tax=Kitasatospora sp. GP30 TaxID=3035084 RepID=UPI000C715456|nr:Uma2 family endonuclease [Kitasatospora sp. GP30]MDH6145370.1 Uma2 family endonuclease [Kitasatospora sp. GP30]